ncbi:MAG: HAMP domain-containing histidine kinase [Bacteroidales bacterium]|nr:HAMP domain-containing histidine kinase [Bacteroidales bacterium]
MRPMYKLHQIVLATVLGLCAAFPAIAENNQPANETKDVKDQLVYYESVLKDLLTRPVTEDNDAHVETARENLKNAAREKGMPSYFYNAYQLSQEYYTRRGENYRAMLLMQEMQEVATGENDSYGIWLSARFLADMYIKQNDYVSAKPHLEEAIKVYNSSDNEEILKRSATRMYCDYADTYPIASDSVRINVKKAGEHAKTHLDTLRYQYNLLRLAALDDNQKEYERLKEICVGDPDFPRISPDAELFFSLIAATRDGSILDREEEIYKLSTVREMKVIANLCENKGYKDFAFNVEKKLVNLMETVISNTNHSRISELDVSMGKASLNAELVNKEHEISRISLFLSILLVIILLGITLFSFIHIRQLSRSKNKDKLQIEELKAANEKVRLANEAKTRFVQNMSHEVRTPLNAIVGFAQLLSLPEGVITSTEKDEYAGHIVNNSKMLTMLLDDILNASSMDKGDYKINYETGEKDFLCEAAISSSEHRLQPGVKLYYAPEEYTPHNFITDPRRVQQILINLLTNACKHTAQGEIKLSSSLAANPGYVTFTVTDTGTGVPPDKAEEIFERFAKLNEFVQGTGLGLSICRDIATRMDAKVFLDTDYPGPGARFVFMVPDKQNPQE